MSICMYLCSNPLFVGCWRPSTTVVGDGLRRGDNLLSDEVDPEWVQVMDKEGSKARRKPPKKVPSVPFFLSIARSKKKNTLHTSDNVVDAANLSPPSSELVYFILELQGCNRVGGSSVT